MSASRFRFLEFELDQIAYELCRDGQPVRLERIPFELLNILVERHGQLVSRDDILDRIWGKSVFHDTEHGINTAVRKIRLALQEDPESPRFIATVPAKGYRFIAPVEEITPAPAAATVAASTAAPAPRSTGRMALFLSGVVLVGVLAMAAFFHFHRAEALAETDTILVADFGNSTGDPVFDDSLKEALSVELAQSPFLNLVSPRQVQQTLAMMKAPADTHLTPEVAHDVCQRANGAAILQGSIAQIGGQYDLILKAVSCSDGQLLASAESRASDKNHVLSALDNASSAIRQKLGESLITVQKFDRPLAQATTPSLDALKAFSLGTAKYEKGDQAASIPYFRRAVELDPDFAVAYASLGRAYQVLSFGDYTPAEQALRKAYALRERASEHEKFEIVSGYYQFVTNQIDETIQNCELWEQSYPRDFIPHRILGFENGGLGRYDRSASEFRKAMQLDPKQALPYAGLIIDLTAMNRFPEARAVFEAAQAHNVETGEVERIRYRLAFVERDTDTMDKLVAALSREPGYQHRALLEQATSAAYFGRLKEARKFYAQALAIALKENDRSTASGIESEASAVESFFGNASAAKTEAENARRLANQPASYAFAVALAEDPVLAGKVVDLVAAQAPPGSFIAKQTLGEFRGAIALHEGNAPEAVRYLASAEPSEGGWFELYRPAYVRGLAYLKARRGPEAAVEFRKIVDHPGIVGNRPYGSLARLGLARAYALQDDAGKARSAYEDFLSLWKDADPDLPTLKQARSELAKLQ